MNRLNCTVHVIAKFSFEYFEKLYLHMLQRENLVKYYRRIFVTRNVCSNYNPRNLEKPDTNTICCILYASDADFEKNRKSPEKFKS